MRQDESLKSDLPEVVVGTPGRIVDHVMEGRLVLKEVKAVVLDEIDGLLSVTRSDHLDMLMKLIPPVIRCQRVLASATGSFSKDVANFTTEHCPSGIRTIGPAWNGVEMPPRVLHLINDAPTFDKKIKFMRRLAYMKEPPDGVLVFVNNWEAAKRVTRELKRMHVPAAHLSGNSSKESRESAVRDMALANIEILVSTEAGARGLDFVDLTHVVNFQLPGDVTSYAHRAGRCGRMGRSGVVISLGSGGTSNRRMNKIAADAGIQLFDGNVNEGELGIIEMGKGAARIRPTEAMWGNR